MQFATKVPTLQKNVIYKFGVWKSQKEAPGGGGAIPHLCRSVSILAVIKFYKHVGPDAARRARVLTRPAALKPLSVIQPVLVTCVSLVASCDQVIDFLCPPVSAVYLEDSFIKSGVFSVAELVRVSRSKYPLPARCFLLPSCSGRAEAEPHWASHEKFPEFRRPSSSLTNRCS